MLTKEGWKELRLMWKMLQKHHVMHGRSASETAQLLLAYLGAPCGNIGSSRRTALSTVGWASWGSGVLTPTDGRAARGRLTRASPARTRKASLLRSRCGCCPTVDHGGCHGLSHWTISDREQQCRRMPADRLDSRCVVSLAPTLEIRAASISVPSPLPAMAAMLSGR